MKNSYDVIVLGGGPVGCFFAHEMAAKGFSVCVTELAKKGEVGTRLQTFHVDKEIFSRLEIPCPKPGDVDYYNEFQVGTYYSPYGQYMKRNDGTELIVKADYPFLVCSLPPFIDRLTRWCEGLGVEFFYETDFDGLCMKGDSVVGAVLLVDGGRIEVSSRLVADCTGMASVGRKALPDSTTVERGDISPREMMYTLLEYVRIKNPEDVPICAEHWAYYKGWIAQGPEPGTAIFGTGANLSYEYAKVCFDRFKSAIQMPEGEVYKRERGVLPYRPASYSMVHDGFVCMGDSACMNKWIGEGIASGWSGAKMAADAAGDAMKNGEYPTVERLWAHNVSYNTTQAANFAYINATAINAVDCTADEMEYEFKKGMIFNDKAMTRLNRTWSADLPFGEVLSLVGNMIGGIITGKISLRSVKGMLRGIVYSTKLKSHYKKFPKTPKGFEKWAKRCDELWKKTGNIADVTERVEARGTQIER